MMKSSDEMIETIGNNEKTISRLEDSGHECSFLRENLAKQIHCAEQTLIMEMSFSNSFGRQNIVMH